MEMNAGGLLEKFETMNKLPDKCLERKLKHASTHSLTLPEVLFAFIVPGIGILTSCVVWSLENLWSRVNI